VAGLVAVVAALLHCGLAGRVESAHAAVAVVASAVGWLFTAALLLAPDRAREGGAASATVGAALLPLGPLACAWAAMHTPLLAASRQYTGAAGPAAAAFVAWSQALVVAACVLVAVAALILFLAFGPRLGARVLRAVPPPLLGAGATLAGVGLVALVATTLWGSRGLLPSDVYLERLPIVAEAPRADGFDVDDRASVPRLVPRASSDHPEHCRVGDVRQRSDRPCSGVVLRHDARTGSWLVAARTSAGLEPILWCQRDPQICPDWVAPCHVAGSMGPARIWTASALVGALVALLVAARGFRRGDRARLPTRAFLAAGCLALTSAPLVVFRTTSGPCPDDASAEPAPFTPRVLGMDATRAR